MERRATHTPLYCAQMMRNAIVRALLLTMDEDGKVEVTEEDTSEELQLHAGACVSRNHSCRRRLHPQHSAAVMSNLSGHVDALVNQCGTMERIRGWDSGTLGLCLATFL